VRRTVGLLLVTAHPLVAEGSTAGPTEQSLADTPSSPEVADDALPVGYASGKGAGYGERGMELDVVACGRRTERVRWEDLDPGPPGADHEGPVAAFAG